MLSPQIFILHLEDDPIDHEILVRKARSLPIGWTNVGSINRARALIDEIEFDFVILDGNVEDGSVMDGLISALAAVLRMRSIRVAVFSDCDESRRIMRDRGIDCFAKNQVGTQAMIDYIQTMIPK